ncbi:MAG: response regulator [Candidatus Methylomirabilales bacterium]
MPSTAAQRTGCPGHPASPGHPSPEALLPETRPSDLLATLAVLCASHGPPLGPRRGPGPRGGGGRRGLQVLQALREQSRTRDVPVVTLTGWGEQEGREALRLGAQEFLTKPVSSSILAATVERLLQKAARERRR